MGINAVQPRFSRDEWDIHLETAGIHRLFRGCDGVGGEKWRDQTSLRNTT